MASEWQGRPLWHEKQPFRAAVICTTWGYSVHVVKSGASERKNRAITVGLAIREPQQSALPPGSRDSGLTTRTCRVSAGKFAARAPCRPAARRLRVRGFLACRLATCDFQARNPRLAGSRPATCSSAARTCGLTAGRVSARALRACDPNLRAHGTAVRKTPKRTPPNRNGHQEARCPLLRTRVTCTKKVGGFAPPTCLFMVSSDRARTGDLRLERAAS